MAGRILLWSAPLVILSALAAIVVYVRLQQGPISLAFMARPIERGISTELKGIRATVDDALLQRSAAGDYEFRLINLRLIEEDGSVVASAPVAAVAIDFARLLSLELTPRRVDLIEPRVSIAYSARDGLSLSFTEPGTSDGAAQPALPVPAARKAQGEAAASPPQAGSAVPSVLKKLDLARVISEYSARARRQQDAASSLAQIGLRQATVDIDYDGQRSSWKVDEFALDLDHKSRRSVISGVARIDSDRGPWTLNLLTEDSEKTGTLTLKASVRDLVPSSLGRAFPNMALLRSLDLPLAGNAAIRFQSSGDLNGADIAIEVGRGLIDFGGAVAAPMLVDAGLLAFNYDAASERLTMGRSTVRWGDSTVTLTGEAAVEAGGDTSSWVVDVRSVSGTLAAEEFKVAPVPLEAFSLQGRIMPASNRIEFSNISIDAGGGKASFAGEVVAGDGPAAGSRIEGQLGPASADVVKALWPRMMSPRARQWAGEHFHSGLLRSATLRFASGVHAPPDSPKGRGGMAESITWDVSGENVALTPVKGGPLLSSPVVSLRIRNHALEMLAPDSMLAAGPSGGVALKQARFAVQDVDAPIAEAELSFKTQSALAPAMDAVRQLKLVNPESLAVPPEKLQGKIDGDFSIRIPLLPEIEAETISITGRAKISDVKTKEKIGIISVQSGSVDLQFAPNEATAKGELILNGVLATVDWRRQTPPGGDPITSPLTLTATLDNADRRQLGIDVGDFIDGEVPVSVAFASPDNATSAAVRVIADLSPATFSISPLAWTKPRGRPGRLEFDLVPATASSNKTELKNFKITGDDIAAEGTVSLSADQKVQDFDFPAVSLNTVSRLQISGKRGARDILDVRATGSTFDGRQFFRSLFTSGSPSQSSAAQKGGIDMTVSIGNVLGYSETNLRDFSMKLSKRSNQITALDARGKLGGGKALIAILQVEPNGTRKIISDTTDAGQTLRLVGFYPNMQGGRGRIDIFLDGRDAGQTNGVLIIEDFKVLGDAVVAEVVSSAVGDGPAIGTAPYGERKVVREVFEFDRMRLPFAVGYGQFAIEDSYLRGPLLGATLRGKVDYTAQKVNLGGTYIPLQGLNNALGGIPLLGQILSGPRGEGIFGITFAVQGAMANPQVIVNPLSLVAPGIFREMFQMTNPNTSLQPRAPSPANVPIDKRVRASSGGAYQAPATVDGWSSDSVVPSKKN